MTSIPNAERSYLATLSSYEEYRCLQEAIALGGGVCGTNCWVGMLAHQLNISWINGTI